MPVGCGQVGTRRDSKEWRYCYPRAHSGTRAVRQMPTLYRAYGRRHATYSISISGLELLRIPSSKLASRV